MPVSKEGKEIKITDKRMFTPDGNLREEYRFLEEKSTAAATADAGAPAPTAPPPPGPARPDRPAGARSDQAAAARPGDAAAAARPDRSPRSAAGARGAAAATGDPGHGGDHGEFGDFGDFGDFGRGGRADRVADGRQPGDGGGVGGIGDIGGIGEIGGIGDMGAGGDLGERGARLELPTSAPGPGPSFYDLAAMLAEPVAIYLGDVELPDGQSAENLEMARLYIDLLDVLRQKTVGNLTAQESGFLEDLLYRMRVRYVQKRG